MRYGVSSGGATSDLRFSLKYRQGEIRGTVSRLPQATPIATSCALVDLSEFSTIPSTQEGRRELGIKLAGLAFPDDLWQLITLEAKEVKVRIWLDVSDELASLPWELLHVERHLALSIDLIRYVPKAAAGELKAVSHPRVLIALADPCSAAYPHLAHAEAELRSVTKALASPECGRFEVSQLPHATASSFKRTLLEQRPDVLHFVGHGDVTPSGGVLVLEGGDPGSHTKIRCDELAELLQEAGTRLVVLSGCFTAQSASVIGAAFAEFGGGVAVGMQMPVKDASSLLFSRAFYAALAEGAPPDEAVRQGRTAVGNDDWPAAVLFSSHPLQPLFGNATAEHNLPIEARPFIGRVAEKEELKSLVLRDETQLVTVTGMGGMGKTRIAKEVARELLPSFEGVWLVECEALGTREELVLSLAGTLGVEPGEDVEHRILKAIEHQRLLLIFDCFERIADEAAFFDRLLARCRDLKIVVTSRKVLGLLRERVWELKPLSMKPGQKSAPEGLDLFRQAAAYANPDFKITRSNRSQVIELVKKLDSVPLAILLAAGRLRQMTLEEIVKKVEANRLEVLKRKALGADRHANMLIVVGDSFALLADEDRELLEALSVFQGGFYGEDAVKVLGGNELEDGIRTLHDNSLIITQKISGLTRYRILDTIREYIDQFTDPAVLATPRRQHAAYFAKRAGEFRLLSERGEWKEAHGAFWMDVANYRAGVANAVERKDYKLIVEFGHALARVYFEAGLISDFELLAEAACVAGSEAGDLALLAELAGLEGERCRREHRAEDATKHWLRRAELCTHLDNAQAVADCYLDIANLALTSGDYDEAEAMLGRFSQVDQSRLSAPIRASALVIRGGVDLGRNHLQEAAEAAGRAEELLREVAIDPQALYVWMRIAQVQRASGELSRSEKTARRLIRDALASGHFQSVGRGLLQLAETLDAAGEVQGAAEALALALQIPRQVSPSLREEVRRKRQSFEEAHGMGPISDALQDIAGRDWKELAGEISRC